MFLGSLWYRANQDLPALPLHVEGLLHEVGDGYCCVKEIKKTNVSCIDFAMLATKKRIEVSASNIRYCLAFYTQKKQNKSKRKNI